MSKDRKVSEDFAAGNPEKDLPPPRDGHAAFLFVLQLPAYKRNGKDAFWAYELSSVSAYEEEAEVLVLPYTMFEVVEAPFGPSVVLFGPRC